MNGQDFQRLIHDAYEPFLKNIGLCMDEPSISGRFYRATFSGLTNSVSITYEPGDDAVFIWVCTRDGEGWSDIDDREKTPRLVDLNSRYMHFVSKAERDENDSFFRAVPAKNKEERQLLKYAKELRLILPKYFNEQN